MQVWLYIAYLTYSALSSEPVNRCMRDGGVSSGGWVSRLDKHRAVRSACSGFMPPCSRMLRRAPRWAPTYLPT